MSEEWRDRAACRDAPDPEMFWSSGVTARLAIKGYCNLCKVTVECLQYAEDHYIWQGVWGGLTEEERTKLRARGILRRRRENPHERRDDQTT